jgi:hypothetical protein
VCYYCSGKIKVTKTELQKLEQTVLSELLPHIKEYSAIATEFLHKGKYHILREVNIPSV